MSNNRETVIVGFLKSIGIPCDSLDTLDGTIIDRDLLLDSDKYSKAIREIPSLKEIFSSSNMTSLQDTASESQKWPLINLVRQVVRACSFEMEPARLSAGYDKLTKKKKFRRVFRFTKVYTSVIIPAEKAEDG
jgi:hypothetical protein